jgi:hypothetical protein
MEKDLLQELQRNLILFLRLPLPVMASFLKQIGRSGYLVFFSHKGDFKLKTALFLLLTS